MEVEQNMQLTPGDAGSVRETLRKSCRGPRGWAAGLCGHSNHAISGMPAAPGSEVMCRDENTYTVEDRETFGGEAGHLHMVLEQASSCRGRGRREMETMQ